MDRRRFLQLTAMGGASLALPGCVCVRGFPPLGECVEPVPDVLVPEATRLATSDSPLAVDVHTHIFNGHDVPMEEYFTRPVLHVAPPMDELLRLIIYPAADVIRRLAPDARAEYDELCDLVAAHSARAPRSPDATERRIRDEIARDDERFAQAIEEVANQEPFRSRYREAEAVELRALGQPRLLRLDARITAEEIAAGVRRLHIERSLDEQGVRLLKVSGIWSFLRRLSARRYHNAFRLLDLYGTNGPVDIFVACTVDFDASLRAERPWCSTRIADQVRLMEAIATLTTRRILPMVGYDPRRDLATDGEALQDVENAISLHGHVGVKLYPPMGFAAFGNATMKYDCDWPEEDDYGARIDARLRALYGWCVERGVPLIAHSGESMGITKDCQKNGGPDDWRIALTELEGLRVCAGHFGGLPRTGDALTERMRGFVDLTKEPAGRRLYVDLAYLPELFDQELPYGDALAPLLEEPAHDGTVADHLLYGTDWYMIAQEPTELSYAADAKAYLRRVGGEALARKVFGANAVGYLDLANRARSVGAAAERGEGGTPHWLRKL